MQILVKPGDIRPTKNTTTKTLRALAIHVIEEGLAGPYAGLDPEEVRTAAEPGTMLPVRVEFTIGKEIIPAHTQRGGTYPLQQVWEAQRAEGDLNKQLSVRTRLPSDKTAIGPIVELQFEVPEAEWASPAQKKAAKVRSAPPEAKEQKTEGGSPKKKSKPGKEERDEVSNTHEREERLTAWYRRKIWNWMNPETITKLTRTHHRLLQRRTRNCSKNAKRPSRKNLRCLVRRRNSNNGTLMGTNLLIKKLPCKHEHRCTKSQTIKVNMNKRNNTKLTEMSRERAKGKRGRKHNRTAKSLEKKVA